MNPDIKEICQWVDGLSDKDDAEKTFELAMEKCSVRKGQRKYYMNVFKCFLKDIKLSKDIHEASRET